MMPSHGLRYLGPVESDLSNPVESVPERFVPAEAEGQLTEAEHLARYLWASSLAAGRRALDAGCGVGYGTRMLAAGGATEAVGVDIAQAVVEAARGQGDDEATFVQGDVHDLPFDDGTFDLVVCFEVIEHVEGREVVIGELVRVLAEDGLLVLSSPNRDAYVPGNPHHVFEYTPQELRAAVAAELPHVELRRQHDCVGSIVLADDGAEATGLEPVEDLRVAKVVSATAGREPYTLVLAGRRPLPPAEQTMVLTGLAEVRKWLELYHEQANILRGQHEHFQNLEEGDEELALLRQELRVGELELFRVNAERDSARRDVEILNTDLENVAADRAAETAQLRDEIDHLREELTRADATLASVFESPSWRITKPLRALKRLLR
jgi:SAM-dependent methyltransferase